MRTALAVSLFLALIATGTAAAAPQATPPRDTSAQPQKGTASIAGRITAADTKRPLRRARVTLTGVGPARNVSTGVDGTYTFKDLPAGRYRLSANRGGYLQLDYGQRRPGEPGRPLEVGEGQAIKQVDFVLPRMSVISGRVTDEMGEPIEGVSVYATRQLFYDGRRRFVPVSGTVRTDDEGEYRIPRLAPGTYHVMASTKETWTVVDNGREIVMGYLLTYFPGVSRTSDAKRVVVGVAAHVGTVDFALVPGRTARITGTAIDSQGKPFARVSLSEEVRGLNFASFGGGPPVTVAPDGTFTALNVPAGEYTLSATRSEADGPPEVAVLMLTVEGTDIESLSLVGSSGGTMSGRVINESGPLPKVSGISVSVAEQYRGQPPPVVLGAFRSQPQPKVEEDGSFTVNHVFGRSRVRVNLPEGWMVKRVQQGGRDVTDKIFELRTGEQVTGIEILITDRVTEVSGVITDEKNAPVVDATVLLFPADADRWFEHSAALRSARPDQQGRWAIKALPVGEYLAIALDYVDDVAWKDPEYLESLRESAHKITIPDGGTQTLTLKLTTPK